MAKGIFDSGEIPIPCPECRKKATKTIAWIKAHSELTCAGCGAVIHLKKDELLSGLKKAEKSIADLDRAFKNLK